MNKSPSKDNVIDLHREVSIALVRSLPCFAVRTPQGQKDPGSTGWDPKTNSTERSRETLDTVSRTNDNLGVHLFGRVVDVDIDSDSPYLMEALEHFLPVTPHIWGRASRPRTHRLYELNDVQEFDPADFGFLDKIKGHDDLKTEVRGGKQSAGRYSILPGSLHPSGEAYEWADVRAARTSLVQVNQSKLMDAVRFACVTALVAPYWQEGIRNELCKAMCGFMHRASRYSEELASASPFDKSDALRLMEGIMEVADDDPHDAPMRRKTLEQTWEKADEGEPVLGASHIQRITGDDGILPLLYAMLASTADLQAMDEMFERYTVIRNTTNVLDLHSALNHNYMMSKEAFIFTLAGNNITTEKGRVPVAQVFLNSTQRVIVDALTTNPQEGRIFADGPRKLANMWSGWGIEPCEEEVKDSDVEMFIDYLRDIVANGDEGLYVWIRDWIADIFKDPTGKPGTALVLVGAQGAGKSMLSEDILRPIIGSAHSAKVSSIERLTTKFNGMSAGKLLIQGEEVISTKRRHDANNLKDAITSKRRTIELKGKDEFEMDDFCRYIFTSNHVDDAVNVEVGDRRYTISEVSNRYAALSPVLSSKEVKAFWSKMFRWLKDDKGNPNHDTLAKIHRWLLQQNTNKEAIRVARNSLIKSRTLSNSSNGLDGWLLSIIEASTPFEKIRPEERGYGHSWKKLEKGYEITDSWPDYARYSVVEEAYKKHVAKEWGANRNAQQIAQFFKDMGMVDDTGRKRARLGTYERVVIREFPSKDRIYRYLMMQGYNILTDEDDEEEDDQQEHQTRDEF